MTARRDFRDYTQLLYEVISSPAGKRDWDASAALFHPDARMVRTGLDADGEPFARIMSVAEYAENAEATLAGSTFVETELEHHATIFGNVAQLSSVYEFDWRSGSDRRKGRGVNFFTLVCEHDRWKIMSIVWDNERAGLSLAVAGVTRD